jgi:hypothetical protein
LHQCSPIPTRRGSDPRCHHESPRLCQIGSQPGDIW